MEICLFSELKLKFSFMMSAQDIISLILKTIFHMSSTNINVLLMQTVYPQHILALQ